MREDIDRVYWAGDAGKEGQTIEENIRNFGGVRDGMEELRVWIDSQTEEEIQRGIREAKPMSAYENLGKSVLCVPLKIMPWALFFPCNVGKIWRVVKQCGWNTFLYRYCGRARDDLCAWDGRDP